MDATLEQIIKTLQTRDACAEHRLEQQAHIDDLERQIHALITLRDRDNAIHAEQVASIAREMAWLREHSVGIERRFDELLSILGKLLGRVTVSPAPAEG